MRKVIYFLVLFVTMFLYSCAPKQTEIILAEYADKKINFDDFKTELKRSIPNFENYTADSLDKIKNYFDLYKNFKLRLEDASDKKFFQDSSLIREFESYKYSLGEDYIKTKLIEQPGLEKFYNKRLHEYRVKSLFIQPDSTRSLLEVKEFAELLIDSLNNGADWDLLFNRYCNNPEVKEMKGDMYWVTAGEMVKVLEEAFLGLEKNQVAAKPVLLQNAYHILKVFDKRERLSEVRVKHILISPVDTSLVKSEQEAFELVNAIYERIIKGESFDSLAVKYSFDKQSAVRGGDLGPITRKLTVREFDEVAFDLKPGELSKPFKTQFGYHIIQSVEVNKIPSFGEELDKIKPIYQKHYFNNDFQLFLDDVKKQFDFKLYKANIDSLIKLVDGLKFLKVMDSTAIYEKAIKFDLFSILGTKYQLTDVANHLYAEEKRIPVTFNAKSINAILTEMFTEDLLVLKTDELMKSKNEFSSLMHEYKNGLAIFKIQNEEIWNKIKIDPVELKEYYAENSKDLIWPDRVTFLEIFHTKKEYVDKFYELYKSGKSLAELDSMFTKGKFSSLNLSENIKKPVSFDYLTELANKQEINSISDIFKNKLDSWSVVITQDKVPSGIKTFEEAEAEITNIIQERKIKEREIEYIKELEKKYNLKVYYENLEKAIK